MPPRHAGPESSAQLFQHRNGPFPRAFTWVVPVGLLVSKLRIKLNRIDGGISNGAATARRQNEFFGGYDHLTTYTAPLEMPRYRN